jgi:hypothetical protein
MFSKSDTHSASASELRSLIDDIVYTRVLIAVGGDDVRAHDRVLRLALRDALARVAPTEQERQRIANEALEAAWARLAAKLENRPPARRAPCVSAA